MSGYYESKYKQISVALTNNLTFCLPTGKAKVISRLNKTEKQGAKTSRKTWLKWQRNAIKVNSVVGVQSDWNGSQSDSASCWRALEQSECLSHVQVLTLPCCPKQQTSLGELEAFTLPQFWRTERLCGFVTKIKVLLSSCWLKWWRGGELREGGLDSVVINILQHRNSPAERKQTSIWNISSFFSSQERAEVKRREGNVKKGERRRKTTMNKSRKIVRQREGKRERRDEGKWKQS